MRVFLLLILCLFLQPCFAAKLDLQEFQKIIIVKEGRQKPLDSFAKHLLLRFSGKTTIDKLSAIEWLSKVVFLDKEADEQKIFLINNPETVEALGIKPENKRRYSYNQIKTKLDKLNEYASEAFSKEEDQRTSIEKEFVRIFLNFHSYLQVSSTMLPFSEHEDFSVSLQAQEILGLAHSNNSLFQIIAVSDKLSQALEKINSNRQLKNEEKEIFALAVKLYGWMESQASYENLFPNKENLDIIPVIKETIEWQNPWINLLDKENSDWQKLSMLDQIYHAYKASDQAQFNQAIKNYNQAVIQELKAANIKVCKVELEIFYNKIKAFTYAKLLYGLAFILACLLIVFPHNSKLWSATKFLVYAGLLLHFTGLASRVLILERPPVSNLYETFIFVSFICVVLGVVLSFLDKNRNLGLVLASFSGLALLLTSGKFATEGDTLQVLQAVLDSNFWLSTHVICITIGYAGVFAAGIVGHIYLIQNFFNKDSHKTELTKIILGILGFGLCFSFIGTMLGGIWADQSWGRFWGWDPKENGALLIVLWVTLIFHARLAGLIKEKGLAVMSVIADMVVITSWFGINLLGVGLHSYGFTNGIAFGLYSYYIAELLFLLIFLAKR